MMLCSYPHLLFPEKISCLALIMDETGLSGHNPGFDGKGRDGKYRASPERFAGELLEASQSRDHG